MEQKLFYLELSSEPIRFDAVSQLTNVFFDDSNRQVSVFSNDVIGRSLVEILYTD